MELERGRARLLNTHRGLFTPGERGAVAIEYGGGTGGQDNETNVDPYERMGERRCGMTSQDRDLDRNHDRVPLSQRLLLRPDEAAAILGLGRSTIYELLRAGELPTVHVGRATRIPARDLHRWIEQRSSANAQTMAHIPPCDGRTAG